MHPVQFESSNAQYNETPTLVLASTSPRRRELMKALGLQFQVIPSLAEENFNVESTPSQIVTELATRKARHVAENIQHSQGLRRIVIGADTIVVCDGCIIGKPSDDAHAKILLQTLQGREHQVFTGVCVIETTTLHAHTGVCETKVHMKSLSNIQIERYVATGEPADKAGAYAIQGIGAQFIHSIAGDYFNVVGLPLAWLCDTLHKFGIETLPKIVKST